MVSLEFSYVCLPSPHPGPVVLTPSCHPTVVRDPRPSPTDGHTVPDPSARCLPVTTAEVVHPALYEYTLSESSSLCRLSQPPQGPWTTHPRRRRPQEVRRHGTGHGRTYRTGCGHNTRDRGCLVRDLYRRDSVLPDHDGGLPVPVVLGRRTSPDPPVVRTRVCAVLGPTRLVSTSRASQGPCVPLRRRWSHSTSTPTFSRYRPSDVRSDHGTGAT